MQQFNYIDLNYYLYYVYFKLFVLSILQTQLMEDSMSKSPYEIDCIRQCGDTIPTRFSNKDKSRVVCFNCGRKERQETRQIFIESLAPEQKVLFDAQDNADSYYIT